MAQIAANPEYKAFLMESLASGDSHAPMKETLAIMQRDPRQGEEDRAGRQEVAMPSTAADARESATEGVAIVTGVIGSDTHIVGNRIMSMALERAGYKVVSLGALTPAEDFVKAAVETNADAILVSSLYGQGELDCRGFRDLCIEAGLDDILLYVGGNLVVGKQSWPDVEKRFLDMGFDRAASPGTRTETVLAWLAEDIAARKGSG